MFGSVYGLLCFVSLAPGTEQVKMGKHQTKVIGQHHALSPCPACLSRSLGREAVISRL